MASLENHGKKSDQKICFSKPSLEESRKLEIKEAET